MNALNTSENGGSTAREVLFNFVEDSAVLGFADT